MSPSVATPPSPALSSMSVSPPSQPLSRVESGELEADISRMNRSFNSLVESVENSFLTNKVPLLKIQKSIKSIPLGLKLQLGECFKRAAAQFLKTESIEQLFIELSYFWDYLNPGLLRFLVKEFGSQDDKQSMTMYLQELKTFRITVKIGEFIEVNQADTNLHSFIYTKIVMVMDQGWENKTLEEVEQFKIEICMQCRLPQSFSTLIHVQRSSIAFVFHFPSQININMEELKPLLQRKRVIMVYVENVCIADWTKQVCIH